jgi:hypothetical protein
LRYAKTKGKRMADADDVDVEELCRLLRGEGGQRPATAPEAAPRARTPRTGPKAAKAREKAGKAGRATAEAKAKPAKAPKRK